MQCAICNAHVCNHGGIHITADGTQTCVVCGKSAKGHRPETHFLHLYEGRIELRTEVQSPVCDYCHQKLTEGIQWR